MPAPRPNVIVFFTDTQRWDCSGLHGNPLGLMPTFDRNAQRGTHLFHAFSPNPVCTPCRACLQTGMYATRTGVFRNAIALPPDLPTLAGSFNDAGYTTGYIGKWHLANETAGADAAGPVPRGHRGGYRHWLAANAVELISSPYHCRLYDADDRAVDLPGYRVDATVDAGIRFLAEHQAEPFFLFLSLLEPHTQNELGAFVAPDGLREPYQGRWTPPDLAGLPSLNDDAHPCGERPQHGLADYWGLVKRIDESLARLMDALRSLGLAENTIVLFTSDHGSHFNTRNRNGKCSGHEASIRVPTALWGGPFRGGGRIEELVSLIDLPPTLLDACDIPVPTHMAGHSLMPLVRRQPVAWQQEVLVQISQSEVGRCVRTHRWKYGVTAPQGDGWRDAGSALYRDSYLYDLEHDPYELVNLIRLASHRPVVERMRQRLIARMVASGETAPQIEDLPTVPSGQRRVAAADIEA